MRVERKTQLGLRAVALLYLAALLAVPVGLVFYRTFEHGFGQFWDAITTPAAIHAFWLTLEIALIAVPLNTVFGIIAALALVRGNFRGKWLIEALIDIPFAAAIAVATGVTDATWSRAASSSSTGTRSATRICAPRASRPTRWRTAPSRATASSPSR